MENSNQYNLNQYSHESIIVSKKKKSKLPLIISIIAILVIVVILLAVFVFSKSARYNKAMKLMDDGKYEDAYEILQKLGDYKDSQDLLKYFRYVPLSMHLVDGPDISFEFIYNKNGLPSTIIQKDGEEAFSVAIRYDADGNVIEFNAMDSTGNGSKTRYFYDSNGNMTKEVETIFYDGEIDSVNTLEYVYDENNYLIKKYDIDSLGEKETYIYENNIYGDVIKEFYLYEGGTSIYERTTLYDYEYDENGNMLKKYSISDGSYYLVCEYAYDDKGRMIMYDEKGMNGYRMEYIYDSKGNKIEEIYTQNGNISTCVYTYDSHGNVIKTAYVYDGVSSDYTRLEYVLVYMPYDTIPSLVQYWFDGIINPG